jgi:2,3-bisphosphoglycerate-independent phosphoglycerate mutase
VEMPVERGIAIMLGMVPVAAPRLKVDAPGTAGDAGYAKWASLAAEALGGFDALYVHIKGPDVPAHDGRAEDKRDVIATIDRAFFGELLPRIDPSTTIVAVTADHSTSSVRKAHTAEPVPLLVSGGPVRPDGSAGFGERACATGSLGQVRGVGVVPRLTQLMRS